MSHERSYPGALTSWEWTYEHHRDCGYYFFMTPYGPYAIVAPRTLENDADVTTMLTALHRIASRHTGS